MMVFIEQPLAKPVGLLNTSHSVTSNSRNHIMYKILTTFLPKSGARQFTVSVLGQDEGYTVKYTPLPEVVPEGETRGNS